MSKLIRSGLLGAAIILASPMTAYAGPCSVDIAALGRSLSQSAALGPATTGALAGAAPGSVKATDQKDVTNSIGTSATGRIGGTAGTKELNAAAGQIATSAEDVRRQQEGLPTAAQAGAEASSTSIETTPKQGASAQPNDRLSQAKMELQKARDLDQSGDKSCADAVRRTQALVNG